MASEPIDLIDARAAALYTNQMRNRRLSAFRLAGCQVDPFVRRSLMARATLDFLPFDQLPDAVKQEWRERAARAGQRRKTDGEAG